ncbi:Eco57I restriction-modification methylase domain-containing protein [Mesorhizobium comanense]|uniref:Eco57I restriction-modification methylase domain-containing protein n=1 Tax=Mesorhizobium comanense TaxID=2502215 RepID=UPI0010F73576|nr:restriction endonuclease [Mesorhizobium comanense]
MVSSAYNGSLFTNDFLESSIADLHDWQVLTDQELKSLRATISGLYARFPTNQTPNEATTENDLIWPILRVLGWDQFLTQQNLTASGRQDVPDALLFVDAAAKSRANAHPEEWRRYEFGAALVESKRWLRPLDRRSEKRDEVTAPSTQMLRYLRRVDDLTNGSLRWGILTNGLRWRLYYSGAQSIAEDFFEIDLGSVMGLSGFDGATLALSSEEQDHWFKVFVLAFRRQAFVTGTDQRTFHQRALAEGKFYEERVAKDLSDLVFGFVFPTLAKGIAVAAPVGTSLQEVREAALILLYRLLFILYAEDRDLLPVREVRYDDYSLREKVRLDVKRRKDASDVFSASAARYWTTIDDLCRAIDGGDSSIGLPPYNGGLFNRERTPLLASIRLGDALIASVIDVLSFTQVDGQRHYINYRDLSVQQLGSIYERLLEHEVVMHEGSVEVRPNIFARKGSGSYYTPDDLVGLILEETLQPLVARHTEAFRVQAETLSNQSTGPNRRGSLIRLDPALKLLELKVCDPAMGSGHFLVSLVDKLADHVIEAMAEAEAVVDWGDYHSPLADRIEAIRNIILDNAEKGGWSVNEDQLDDRHIIRRMVLKRCVYGVDKNPMAVELAKVALWLHTFTVGAPLSFLDHHLRAGDSLFGSWVKSGIEKVAAYGSPLVLHEPIRTALQSASQMQIVEGLTDAEIAEAHRSQDIFDQISDMTAPLNALLSFIHALDWIDVRDKERKRLIQNFFDGQFGDPVAILLGKISPKPGRDFEAFEQIFREASELITEQRFLHWQVAFPGVWSNWEQDGLTGGFDAIVGNPPWDRMKLQEVEWFAARRPEIAQAQRKSDRETLVAALVAQNDPLARDFERANARAESAARVARVSGDYPLLSSGDINLYALFVERTESLAKQDGMVGLLVPIGIGTDITTASFFSKVAGSCRLKTFIAFENRRGWLFPDVHHEDQPTLFAFSRAEGTYPTFKFAVKLARLPLADGSSTRPLTHVDCRRINPNTGTVPIFRNERDAELTLKVYRHLPVLVDRSSGTAVKSWDVSYRTMFHMTNDSKLFRTKGELEEVEKGYPSSLNHYGSASGDWLPLYEGKMISIYNHRYAGVRSSTSGVSGQGVAIHASIPQLEDPSFYPIPRYWVANDKVVYPYQYALGFNDICNTNNRRSLIAAIVPRAAYGNKLPILSPSSSMPPQDLTLLLGNLCSVVCDYIARQKIQSRNLNKYILEQIPCVPPAAYDDTKFGSKTAREIVCEAVVELTYTAHDMEPFAMDMGYVNGDGTVKTPFTWNEERRIHLKAKLDAVFFHLYGVKDRDDVRYIYSTFPLVESEESDSWGGYRSRDLCLHYMNALGAGHPDAVVQG